MSSEGRIEEFELIARVFAPLAAGQPFAKGLIDDAAVISPEMGHDLVVTTDTLSAGIHFRDDDPPETVAARALAANVSDLAAMGAMPVGYTLAIAAPAGLSIEWYEAFANRLAAEQERYGIGLLGGDTTSMHGGPSLTITAIGQVPQGRAILRSTGREGDDLWVTGTIGDAALGLDILESRLKPAAAPDGESLTARFVSPVARIGVVGLLQRHATSAIDVSDGLLSDIGHLAAASAVAAMVDQDQVPVSPAARRLLEQPGMGGRSLWRRLVTGGDDYEVVFTAATADRAAIEADAQSLDFPVSRIGRLVAKGGEIADDLVVVRDASGAIVHIDGPHGYRHFAD
ncbi:MAG: thiamine-phosphate kinase [Rhodospirillales bacterium]